MVSMGISRIFDEGANMPDNRMIRDSFTVSRQRRVGKMALETITGYTGTQDAKDFAAAIQQRVNDGAKLADDHAPASPQSAAPGR
jgi:hypothetical protein